MTKEKNYSIFNPAMIVCLLCILTLVLSVVFKKPASTEEKIEWREKTETVDSLNIELDKLRVVLLQKNDSIHILLVQEKELSENQKTITKIVYYESGAKKEETVIKESNKTSSEKSTNEKTKKTEESRQEIEKEKESVSQVSKEKTDTEYRYEKKENYALPNKLKGWIGYDIQDGTFYSAEYNRELIRIGNLTVNAGAEARGKAIPSLSVKAGIGIDF